MKILAEMLGATDLRHEHLQMVDKGKLCNEAWRVRVGGAVLQRGEFSISPSYSMLRACTLNRAETSCWSVGRRNVIVTVLVCRRGNVLLLFGRRRAACGAVPGMM